MRRVFDFEPGVYLISDESSLFDFTGVEEMERKDIQRKIREVYDVDVSDLASGNRFDGLEETCVSQEDYKKLLTRVKRLEEAIGIQS